jgi:hypothetical protein
MDDQGWFGIWPGWIRSLFVWLVADGWCWFVLRETYCYLIAGGWFVLREKHCCLVADKPCVHGLGSDIRLRHGGVIAGRGVASGYRDKKERMAWI